MSTARTNRHPMPNRIDFYCSIGIALLGSAIVWNCIGFGLRSF